MTTLGLVEITVTGIGTPELRASAGVPEPPSREGLRQSLTPVAEAGRGGIQLRAVSSGTFTFGPRGIPGSFRYIFVTFEVRNASSNGTAYTTPRENLTFVAVSTSSTISGTAVKEILKFDGSPASTADAQNWTPTGAAYLTIPQTISALSADVLQVFTEAEAVAAAAAVVAGSSAVAAVVVQAADRREPRLQSGLTPATPATAGSSSHGEGLARTALVRRCSTSGSICACLS